MNWCFCWLPIECMEQDFPLIRAQLRCPLCQGEKQTGAVVCWPCYHRYDMRYGDGQVAPHLLRQETALARQAEPTSGASPNRR